MALPYTKTPTIGRLLAHHIELDILRVRKILHKARLFLDRSQNLLFLTNARALTTSRVKEMVLRVRILPITSEVRPREGAS
jgi:hypothetical protein